MKIETRFDRKATRGIYKIAVEAIALLEGLKTVSGSGFDAAKHFVSEGGGDLRVVMLPNLENENDYEIGPFIRYAEDRWLFGMSILGFAFGVIHIGISREA